ncbi:hypothetical protein ABT294_30410 [Nonomuraea sp. NPDC000554]|uniref:hypothetical protein n=1 Tax=Nonomuraea sp. NPDC000554 TaxID=3154259 RepID=UPI003325AFCD
MPNPPHGHHEEHHMADRMLTQLEPMQLDELADEIYRSRRSADLVRALQTPRTRHPVRRTILSKRRMLWLTVGVATAGLAAAIVIPGVASRAPGATTTAIASASPSASTARLDVHTVLLAAAESAAREPAAAGRYWYTLVQTTTRVDHIVNKQAAKEPPGADTADAARPNVGKATSSPFTASVSTSQESWTARGRRDRSRTITGIDYKLAFDSPADEARWKAMGSPRLGDGQTKQVNDYDMPIRFTIGQQQVSMADLAKLPAGKDELDKELRRRYQADVNDPKYPLEDSYPQYVWSTAQDLLAGPITSDTRAALYRVLADQPGITLIGQVTDELGRSGSAIAMRFDQGGQAGSPDDRALQGQLIIDQDTSRLLAYQAVADGHRPQLSVTYKQMGWTDSLDKRP